MYLEDKEDQWAWKTQLSTVPEFFAAMKDLALLYGFNT